MKKWWIWLVVVAVAGSGIGVVLGWPETPVAVETETLQPRRVEQTVTCSGLVEAADTTGVVLPMNCVLEQVHVRVGQQVEKGAVVATVNKEATRKLLGNQPAALMGLASMEAELTAPETGIVVAVAGTPGTVLEAGNPCAVLAPRSALRVRITIREKDLPSLETGMQARVSGDGFSRDSYRGALAEISYTAGASGTGAVVEGVVTLEKNQADASLRLGLTAKAAIVTAVSEEALVVPYEAVVSDSDGRDYVYVLEEGLARRRELTVAAQLGDGLLLADGGLEGAQVILEPEKIFGEGMAVHATAEEGL